MSKGDTAEQLSTFTTWQMPLLKTWSTKKLQFLVRPLQAGSKSKSVCERAYDKNYQNKTQNKTRLQTDTKNGLGLCV